MQPVVSQSMYENRQIQLGHPVLMFHVVLSLTLFHNRFILLKKYLML
jgi:hypothetical protein